jgi:hypothetical protein
MRFNTLMMLQRCKFMASISKGQRRQHYLDKIKKYSS